MMDKEPDDEMDNQPVTEDISESEGTSRFYRHGGSNQYQPHTNTNRKQRMKSGRHESNEDTKEIRMRSEAEINSTTASRDSQDEESGIISQEVTPFPRAPSIHIEIKIEISDGYPKTNRNDPEHSRAEEHEDVTTQKATLFQDNTKQQIKIKYNSPNNSPKLTREAPEPRKARNDHKVIIDKEAGQFLEDTEQLVEIMHKVTDGKTEMTREATEHTNSEHDNVISQKVTSILDDTNHQVKIKNNGDGDPKLTTEATNRNDVDEHGDDRQEATFFPADAKQYVEINDEVTSGCPQANTQFPKCSKAEEHKSDNQEVKQFAKSIKTNTENETENCVSLLCAKCGSEATPSPYGPKQHIETNVGITDGYQKTNRDGPRYRRADEHEDDTVQDATLFHDNTKEHMTEVIQRNPEMTKAASECNKVDITQDTTPTPTDTKPVEIKTEAIKSNPELTREVHEYSSADEHESLTGVKPDDTKQHKVMRNELIDANPKLTEETAKQNKANEHDIIGHEPTSFHKDGHGTHLQQEGEQTKKISKKMTGHEMDYSGSQCEEKKKLKIAKLNDLFNRLKLVENLQQKIKTSDVLQITSLSVNWQESCKEKDVVEMFLQKLLMMDYRARYITTEEEESTDREHTEPGKVDEEDLFAEVFDKVASFPGESHKDPVHPMDVQMAVFHCSDHFLKQLILNKLAQCQYALPLLVPNPFTREIEFPLWTFRQIRKSWKTTDSSGKKISKTQAAYEAETPMVAFFRFGSASSSKSQLMNSLINEKHQTFFHRHCPGSSKNRLLMDGVVEIAWYCPSGKETDYFPDCVAFCNLHGDAENNQEQLEILTEMSSVNVVLLCHANKIRNKEILENLLKGAKPLICLLSEDESGVTRTRNGKYRIGLKNRNQSDVAKNLRMAIKECVSTSSSIFKIEDLYNPEVMRKDEDDPECKRGNEAAKKIMSHLEGNKISTLKEKHLPCQGTLWHEWCGMNKDLHRLHGNNLEKRKSEKQREMKQIREKQHKYRLSGLMENFVSSLNHLGENEKLLFLKWVGILLDKRTSDDLLDLHQKYNEKWTSVLDLKKKHDKPDKIKEEQTELENLSEKLNAAMFGLEHILREMGQIYESFMSVQTHIGRHKDENITALPKLAAELLKSGHPLELMDGDAAHVPLIWVSAVLDELVKILGEQRVFVLSVLGIQSSGKSTMLNAMFGLQFAVSAGRCTRGAFMQLVRVSEEMKEEVKFDYILIVDTEGLRALELAGKSTQHHDNELATFVVGLGDLTLINIFGENPAEMQDILQIVVQAFLRMKEVRLNPRCMFVHQNVSDITAGEKNMEGRRRLQEKLDEMTKLAAKEEDNKAECFSDVIEFSVLDDVYYFAQLWEGSPPMAPPNPCYSRNVQDLKKDIFKKAERSTGMSLSQFKLRVSDLWNAILSENFVFSFKNTLEIAVYRKLETEFGKWTWALRSAMLDTEEKLYTRIANKKPKRIEEKEVHNCMKDTKEEMDQSMKTYFEEDKDKETLIQWRARCETKITQLYEDLLKDTKQNVNEVIQQQQARESFEHKKTQYDEKLFSLSKDLALKLKAITNDEQDLKDEFDKLWDKWVTELTRDTPPERRIDFWEDAVQILSVGNEPALVYQQKKQQDYKHIDRRGDYSLYISKLKRQKWVHYVPGRNKLSFEENELVRTLTINVIKYTEELINKVCDKITRLGYKDSYIQEITDHVRKRVEEHQSEDQRIKLRKEFTLDLCLHVCELASHRFTECHKQFREANDTRVYLSKQKPRYYSVFKNYCRGATTTKVFGDLICSNLRESILQSVYNKTAIGLAAQIRSDMKEFNGNRSNLEKHILKRLAEEENFEKYMEYIHHPLKHFKVFITEKVNEYINDDNTTILTLFKGNLIDKEQRVINAVHIATGEVKKSRGGDADMWIRSFSSSLKDDLSFKEITFTDLREITDFDFLQQVVGEGLTEIMSELDKSFNSVKDINMEKFRKKPDEILIEHLCQCCWVQCPFCKAICTNTMEGHDGDHSVPLHRVNGIDGWHYRGTTNLCSNFCTTNVQSDKRFYPNHKSEESVPYKSYRSAGGVYATWSITPDNSEIPYWKWFVCRFQKDLEKHYEKTFQGRGEIPSEWRDFTKEQAIESLDKYI